ncbi:unnamed protein product, partial [Ectocarpus sp. 12 AP-2014]
MAEAQKAAEANEASARIEEAAAEKQAVLLASGCPHRYVRVGDEQLCEEAAKGGHLGVLQWLRDNGCPWDEGTCSYAAWGGYLEVLQWTRNNGCPWDKETCSKAAWRGHLEALQWARNNGCPWDKETCSKA